MGNIADVLAEQEGFESYEDYRKSVNCKEADIYYANCANLGRKLYLAESPEEVDEIFRDSIISGVSWQTVVEAAHPMHRVHNKDPEPDSKDPKSNSTYFDSKKVDALFHRSGWDFNDLAEGHTDPEHKLVETESYEIPSPNIRKGGNPFRWWGYEDDLDED